LEIALMHHITVAPIPTRPGYYTARCDGRLLCRSRQPFLDGARELLAAGQSATAVIAMKHGGSRVEALRSTIGAAAALTVSEEENRPPRFKRWKPRYVGEGWPPIAFPQNSDRDLVIMEAAE
jgi:hypothetical protein